jgi:hypothetical protein
MATFFIILWFNFLGTTKLIVSNPKMAVTRRSSSRALPKEPVQEKEVK